MIERYQGKSVLIHYCLLDRRDPGVPEYVPPCGHEVICIIIVINYSIIVCSSGEQLLIEKLSVAYIMA